MPRSRLPSVTLGVALALVVVSWAARYALTSPLPRAPEPTTPSEPAPEPVLTEEVPPPEPSVVPEVVVTPTPVVDDTAPIPSGIDPCAPDDAASYTRPSIDELLQLRIAELDDRMRHALSNHTASPALREGLLASRHATGAELTRVLEGLSRAPDRRAGGFDTYVAVLDVLAAQALGAHDAATAVRLASTATRASPTDSLSHVVLAIAYERRGDRALATESFGDAFRQDPEEPAIAFALATRLRDGADPALAVEALDRYLEAEPRDVSAARLRARLALRVSGIPAPRTLSRDGVAVVAPGTCDPELTERALATVHDALGASARLLGLPRRESLTVLVYPDRRAMVRATCAQGWAGAIFDGALHTDAETLARADAAMTTLRHESLHAAIHPQVPNVPTWLDEGLAQYAAQEEGRAHFQSYALMMREHTWVPFASMNDAFLVIDDSTDAGLAYHQSLAMVLWLVDRRGERGIADAITWLASGGDPTRVLEEASRSSLDGEGLLTFLSGHRARTPD